MSDSVLVFTYGSLIDETSRRQTIAFEQQIFPAKLYGFRRVFNLASSYRIDEESGEPVCVLNLEEGSPDDSVNGLCIRLDGESYEQVEERESTYSVQQVEVYDWEAATLPRTAVTFVGNDNADRAYRYLIDSQQQLEYVRECVRGCAAYGEEFLSEFKRNTHFRGVQPEQYEDLVWSRL